MTIDTERIKDLRIQRMIRTRYSFNAELAILRQRDTKPEEFNTYFAFCEDCKSKVAEQMAQEAAKKAERAAAK